MSRSYPPPCFGNSFDDDYDFLPPHLRMYWNAVYYPNWRIYRDQPPVSLNFDVLSHVFYAFAW
jgi:chitinase